MNFEKVPGIWLALSGAAYCLGFVACLLLASSGFTIGFLAGGALVLVNSFASARKIKKAQFSARSLVTASLLGGFYLRLVLLGICLFVLIAYAKLDALGLVTGLSVVPAGLFIMLVLIYIANRRPEEVR
jgi:hypothetical protein